MFTLATTSLDPGLAPLGAGLAISVVLEREFELRPRIKWPNDVLVHGHKISGVLCEYAEPWLYVGIGLNLHQDSFPAQLNATSVALARRQVRGRTASSGRIPADSGADDIDRDRLLLEILTELARNTREVCEMVNSRLWRAGSRVTVRLGGREEIDGLIREIDSDGCLVVSRNGVNTRIVAGELLLPSGASWNE